ncbi:MAG: NapC/NirT family cytochrome c [Armatimonadetes bacterium]|nr:NapC/NirT family cytochrome c [Armatimonadota bacterium]
MDTIYAWFRHRPLRLIGGFLVFLSVGLLAFLVLLDMLAGLRNPYLGIIAYLILPIILIIGLLLVPLDSWIQRRRVARGEPVYPTVDLCDPVQRRIATFFAATSAVILIVMTVVTYKGVQYMDTTTFCGRVCHRVMIPEFTAYTRSPHASVACIECHIGPGASWFVRSKLSGLPQVWHYTIGDYPRPLPTPVVALRPSRETCETCHWPEAFYGSTLITRATYQQDAGNTPVVKSMFMRVGSGGVQGSGIHSHIINKIHYLPAVAKRTEIAWLRIERPDGTKQEFVNPTYKDDLKKIRRGEAVRLMDCIDCHNRAAHDFEPFEWLLDDSITRRRVDASLPFIKRRAMLAVGPMDRLPTVREQARVVSRIRRITSYYEDEYPDIYKVKADSVRRSVRAIERDYLGSAFPHMRVWPGSDIAPGTYPNWRTHEGCFRCHGAMVAVNPKAGNQEISADCNFCHKDQSNLGITGKTMARRPMGQRA